MPKTTTQTDLKKLTIYQAKTAAFLSWSQPFIYRLIQGLSEHTNPVVLTQRIENPDLFAMPKIEVLPKSTLLNPIRAYSASQQLQKQHNGSVLHAHFGYTAAKMIMMKIMMQLPMVVTFGGKDLTVHAKREKTGQLYRIMFDLVEQFVAVSDSLRHQAIELGCPENKIVTIRRGVPVEQFTFHDRSQNQNGQVRLLMVSRFTAKKAHVDVLEALRHLKQYQWQLVLVGEGEEEHHIRKLARETGIADRLQFMGVLPIEQVRQQMNQADVMLHPSVTGEDGDQEGIPNSLVEAQATGLPAIATYHGGIPEVIIEGQTGHLIDEHDVHSLQQHIETLITNPRQRLQLGQNAREHIEKELSLDNQIQKYLDIYQTLAHQYPASHPSLTKPRLPNDLPQLLLEVHNETTKHYDFSIAELLEDLFMRSHLPMPKSPIWYDLYWRIKRVIPRRIKFAIKKLIYFLAIPLIRRKRKNLAGSTFWNKIKAKGFRDI